MEKTLEKILNELKALSSSVSELDRKLTSLENDLRTKRY